jgi:mRNA interferase HigB
MRLISQRPLKEFWMVYPDAQTPLRTWIQAVKSAAWRNLAEVRRTFPHADFVDPHTVFNIGGNKYRLITVIKYKWQVVYVRHILTHADYDLRKWKTS